MSEPDMVEHWLELALVQGNVDPAVTRIAIVNALQAYREQKLALDPLRDSRDDVWPDDYPVEMVEYDGRNTEGFDVLEPKHRPDADASR
jgi:hypothetical protein